MKIITEVVIPDERVENVVKSIMENMPECSQSMDCLRWKYEEWEYTFQDYEDGKKYVLDKAKLLAAFPLMYTSKWPAGLKPPPMSNNEEAWQEWLTHADADYFDAFVQLACFREVIYG